MLKKRWKWLVAIALVAGAIAVFVIQTEPGPVFYFSAGWLAIIALLLWSGNRFLTTRLDSILPWAKWGNFRFFIHLALGLLYLLLLINITYWTIKTTLTDTPPNAEQLIVTNVWGIIIFVPVFSIYFSLHFLRHWRSSELAVEKFQKENIRSQLDSLKNHLDPHFLFNNLNILSSLVDKDKAASKEFIRRFAEVYRSILRSKSDDLIPLEEELRVIGSYVYLIKMRFEENILFNISVSPGSSNKLVPPLTLQMLVENAIKHNIITENQPLRIEIQQPATDYLVVSNTLNRAQQESSGLEKTGLANITRRYAHFTSKPVKIQETETSFEVHIPLLVVENL
jgi:hypothetical protein